MVEFQDGFTWPMFDINTTVLTRVGLGSLPPMVGLNLFRSRLNTWTVILVGHVVKLSGDDPQIFLKLSTVKACKDLIKHASQGSQVPSGRIDIAKERSYIRTRIQQGELEHALTTLSPTTKRSLSPTSRAMFDPAPKRFCHTAEAIIVSKPVACSSAATRIVTRKQNPNHVRSPVATKVLTFIPDPIYIHGSESELDSVVDDPDPFSSPLQCTTSSHTPRIKTELADIDLTLSQPVLSQNGKTSWPGHLSVKEVIEGFLKVEELSRQPNSTVPKAFEHYFGIQFPRSTFYEHHDHWNHASQQD